MNTRNQAALLVATLTSSLALSAPIDAVAAPTTTGYSNAIDKCQAFAPGTSSLLRFRVSGVQNVGSTSVTVACSFPLNAYDSVASVTVQALTVFFQNGTAAPVSVSCSMLTGNYITGFGTIESQTIEIAANSNNAVYYGENGPYDVYAIGLNCSLPPNVTIAATQIEYGNTETN